MTEPVISIVVPVYNGNTYLASAIKSVQMQKYQNLEILLVDDGSSDDGTKMVARKNIANIKILWQKNLGQYAAMNQGYQASIGEIVCFVNQDDLLADDSIRMAVDYLLAHPESDAVSGRISYIDERGRPTSKPHPLWRFPIWTYPYTSNIYHGALYVRRKFLEEHRIFFDPRLRYAGDYDWILRLLDAGISIGRVDAVLLRFRAHEQQTSEIKFQSMRREIFEIAKRHNLSLFLIGFTRKIFFLAGLWDLVLWQGFFPVIKYLRIRLNRKRD